MKKILVRVLESVLKYLARLIVARYEPAIIAITGNVGKTSAKEAIARILKNERIVRAPSKNFNNELGVPLSIIGDFGTPSGPGYWVHVMWTAFRQIVTRNKEYPEVVVLEYGIDRPGDMKRLLEIAKPHIGVFTAMGETPVHIEFFTGTDAMFKEKAKLIAALPATGFAILNADDERVRSAKSLTRAHTVTFGFSPEAHVRILNFRHFVEEHAMGVSFKLSYGGSVVPFRVVGSLGKSAAYSIASAVSIGLLFNVNLLNASQIFSEFLPPKGRKRVLKGVKQSLVIDDTYNAAPLSMEEALAVLKSVPAKRKIAVLGDMLELGPRTLEAHESVGRMARDSADLLFTIGIRGKIIGEGAVAAGMPRKKIFSFSNVHELAMQLAQKVQRGDVILVKGSQGVRLERVVKALLPDVTQAEKLLIRQEPEWLRKPGLYD
jgi:UDP-N-acetylmuramoyl-tripeptide--D-alanyl-D-alanine ligase